MNQPNLYADSFYLGAPYPNLPEDHIQAVFFLASRQSAVGYLHTLLGISLETQQYDALFKFFIETEARNPTYGELRMLGHMLSPASPTGFVSHTAVGELYTQSTDLMDTWADAMQGFSDLQDQPASLCRLDQLLSLPASYVRLSRGTATDRDTYRVLPLEASAHAFTEGYQPYASLKYAEDDTWQVYRKTPSLKPAVSPRPGDAILMLPLADLCALQAFLSQHSLGTSVKALAASTDGNALQPALSLCGGYGLTIQLDSLLPKEIGTASPIEALWQFCQSASTPTSPLVLLLAHAKSKAHLYQALADYGFSPRLLGTVEKKPYLSIFSRGNCPVHLQASFIEALCPRMYTCTLPTPSDLCNNFGKDLQVSEIYASQELGLSIANGKLRIESQNADAYTPSMQLMLSLCMKFAAVGADIRELRITPLLTLEGDAHAPILVSAACGLYRAATELEIPLTDPVIRCCPATSDQKTALTLSCAAYTQSPTVSVQGFTQAESPLHLTVWEQPAWQDIRGLLYTVAKTVRETGGCCIPLLEKSLPEAISQAVPPSHPYHAALFDTYQKLLTETTYLGFLTEGISACRGLHIGMTVPAPENPFAAPPKSHQDPPQVALYPPVSLQDRKYQETKRRKELTAMENIKAFEPLCKTPRTVLLDTDIGPDCDDVGALAVLIYYAKQYGFPIGGVCNCTSNKAGNGVIDAICRRCGIETPPLGQWHGKDFMDQIEHCKYNTAVAEAHSEAYRNGTLQVDDEVTYYRKRLAAAKDGEVMVISIGMFNNLAALLESPADDISPLTGVELVKAKVYALVSMAAILPQGRECNVMCDYKASEKVFNNWPTAIYLSDFHIGVNVKTGYPHITDEAAILADPLPMSYHLYTKAWNWEGAVKGQNASYDLTAVQFAALGDCELYGLDTPGDLEFYAEVPDLPDATRFIPNPMGNKIFMTKKVSDEEIADSLQKILVSF